MFAKPHASFQSSVDVSVTATGISQVYDHDQKSVAFFQVFL